MLNLHTYVLERIRPLTLRERHELAARSGVSYWTINKYAYEQIKEPSVTKLQKIADALAQ